MFHVKRLGSVSSSISCKGDRGELEFANPSAMRQAHETGTKSHSLFTRVPVIYRQQFPSSSLELVAVVLLVLFLVLGAIFHNSYQRRRMGGGRGSALNKDIYCRAIHPAGVDGT